MLEHCNSTDKEAALKRKNKNKPKATKIQLKKNKNTSGKKDKKSKRKNKKNYTSYIIVRLSLTRKIIRGQWCISEYKYLIRRKCLYSLDLLLIASLCC